MPMSMAIATMTVRVNRKCIAISIQGHKCNITRDGFSAKNVRVAKMKKSRKQKREEDEYNKGIEESARFFEAEFARLYYEKSRG